MLFMTTGVRGAPRFGACGGVKRGWKKNHPPNVVRNNTSPSVADRTFCPACCRDKASSRIPSAVRITKDLSVVSSDWRKRFRSAFTQK